MQNKTFQSGMVGFNSHRWDFTPLKISVSLNSSAYYIISRKVQYINFEHLNDLISTTTIISMV